MSKEKSETQKLHEFLNGRNGNSNGSALGELGNDIYKKEKAKNTPIYNPKPSSKLICNYLLEKGYIDQTQFMTSIRDFRERLTRTHLRGYHIWAVPTVRLMRRSRKFTKFITFLFNQRINYISTLSNQNKKASFFSLILCKFGETISYSIGLMIKPNQRWKRVYDDDNRPAQLNGYETE